MLKAINGDVAQEILRTTSSDPRLLAKRLAACSAADAIEVLNTFDARHAAAVIEHLSPEAGVQAFNNPGLVWPWKIIEQLPHERSAAILAGVHPDRRAEIYRNLSDDCASLLDDHLSPAVKASLEQILKYPRHSAGAIMTTDFVSVPTTATVEDALQQVRKVGGTTEQVYAIYLLAPDTRQLKQIVSLRQLILADPKAAVTSIAAPRTPVAVPPLADREDVARLISVYDLLAIPVIDDDHHMLGIVTVDDVIDAIVHETTEDVQKLGGMEALDQPYMRIGFLPMIRKRAGWLCALFLSEMLTASAMQHFQGELEKAVVLTLFIPLIMSSGGNSGSQATSLIIRALALREVRLRDWFKVIAREVPAGLLLGAILGVIGIARISLWQHFHIFDYGPHWQLVAATVGAALVGIVMFGSVVGSMLPFILKRLGFDPASASAPFVATLVDVTGLVIYFSVAFVFLRGTLL